jgi:hypothetical protein
MALFTPCEAGVEDSVDFPADLWEKASPFFPFCLSRACLGKCLLLQYQKTGFENGGSRTITPNGIGSWPGGKFRR